MDSIKIIIMRESNNCIVTDTENIVVNLFESPLPNSHVIKRLIEHYNAPDITANIATTPPTTL